MPTRIAVVSDTHLYDWDDVHPGIKKAVSQADMAVHCGDLVRMSIVDGFRRDAKKAIVVHGNSDPIELRQALPYVETIDVEGVRIGITHPAWGGPEFDPEELLPDFPTRPDVILYGHIHVPLNEIRHGVLFVNPGQGYASFLVPNTIATLTVDQGKVSAEIVEIEPAR